MTEIEKKVRQALKTVPAAPAAVVPASARYLDLAENIVRRAIKWQDAQGRIIDPYARKETNAATARFTGALGLQILQNRCADLLEPCVRSLDCVLDDLFYQKTNWGEFIVKEACMAFWALQDKVAKKHAAKWKRYLSAYDPELAYARTFTNVPADQLQNFCTFAIAGEVIKQKLGLTSDSAFIERYVKQQLAGFDENGMYKDPASPLIYDMVSRMNFSLALWAGYHGNYFEDIDEKLRLGALAQLLYQSPAGECPYGGRSNQQNFGEAAFALICEFEASRWEKNNDQLLSGAFKRAAALAVDSLEKYLSGDSIYSSKNFFPPELQHGRPGGYGFYGVYTLLIAGQFGFAKLLADNSIRQGPVCPAESGAYVFISGDSFHKIFAGCSGVQVEIDRNADFDYDATGLGRMHFIGCPPALALSTPITATPKYLTSVPPAPVNIALGPGWDGLWLAGLNKNRKLSSKCDILKESRDCVEFKLSYRCDSGAVSETYRISADGVTVSVIQEEGKPVSFRVPLLETDGRDRSEIEMLHDGFKVSWGDFVYLARSTGGPAKVDIEKFSVPNGNGIYRTGNLHSRDNHIEIKFSTMKKNMRIEYEKNANIKDSSRRPWPDRLAVSSSPDR
ncbi:MAG: hypothetical protein PHV82_03830 [Victivallaceae bacterium]|nr:hypothetical protein [Victivallaceae bacterium]